MRQDCCVLFKPLNWEMMIQQRKKPAMSMTRWQEGATPIGNRYVLMIFSKYTVIYLIREKSQILEKLKAYIAIVSKRFQRNGENMWDMKNYLAEQGTEHQLTIPYTPKWNGITERRNRRCMLLEAELSVKYWGEAINSATYLQNKRCQKCTV